MGGDEEKGEYRRENIVKIHDTLEQKYLYEAHHCEQ